MASVVPQRTESNSFRIHEDVPSTEDTQMNEEVDHGDHGDHGHGLDDGQEAEAEEQVEEHREQEQEYQESEYSESSDDETVVDGNILQDMEKLQSEIPGFRNQYRLIKRIGEGMLYLLFSIPRAGLCN